MNIHIRTTLLRTTVFACLCMPVYTVMASDEADFSAPYITFEDGKLVTKDPTSSPPPAHASGMTAGADVESSPHAAAAPGIQSAGDPPQSESIYIPLAVTAVITLAVILLVSYRVKSRQRQ